MPRRDPALLLEDIRSAIARIERYTSGLQREHFVADEKQSTPSPAIWRSLVKLCVGCQATLSVNTRIFRGSKSQGCAIASSTTTSVSTWKSSGKSCRPHCPISESSSRESHRELSDHVTAVRRLTFSPAIHIPPPQLLPCPSSASMKPRRAAQRATTLRLRRFAADATPARPCLRRPSSAVSAHCAGK